MPNKPTTTLYMSPEEVRHLRQAAGALGLYQTRGAGTGRLGNVSNLVRAVAQAYAQDPKGTRDLLLRILNTPSVKV